MERVIPLLDKLAQATLPKKVEAPDECATARLLRGLGWVVADSDSPAATPVTVKEVTFAGRAVLEVARKSGAARYV